MTNSIQDFYLFYLQKQVALKVSLIYMLCRRQVFASFLGTMGVVLVWHDVPFLSLPLRRVACPVLHRTPSHLTPSRLLSHMVFLRDPLLDPQDHDVPCTVCHRAPGRPAGLMIPGRSTTCVCLQRESHTLLPVCNSHCSSIAYSSPRCSSVTNPSPPVFIPPSPCHPVAQMPARVPSG